MITKETYIEDLVEDYPELVVPLRKYGIICIACGEPVWGTLGELMEKKGIDNPEEIVIEMNNIVAKGEK
jgi:methionine synthase II (cobalamin-independent)